MCDARNEGLTEGKTIKKTASHGKPAVNGSWGVLKCEVWNTPTYIYTLHSLQNALSSTTFQLINPQICFRCSALLLR